MTRDIKEIRKRIEKRKRQQNQWERDGKNISSKFESKTSVFFDQESENEVHPLFRRDIFVFKILLSAILVLIVGLSYSKEGIVFEKTRQAVSVVMEKEFQFATVSKWYEDQFGESFALLPSVLTGKDKGNDSTELANGKEYAVPAAGKVTQTFEQDGQGILVETAINQNVNAVQGGTVVYIGEKTDIGLTVAVSHSDGSETWYGQLSETSVQLYDMVRAKQVVGKVAAQDGAGVGAYYFALKKDGKFIDPKQVISFE